MSNTTPARSDEYLDLLASYMPLDRRHAHANDSFIRNQSTGTVCIADLSGSTPLTEALAKTFGTQRGAEEITHYLNLVYDALINAVDQYGGSVIGFTGDAITCWFDGDDGLRGCASALEMMAAMQTFAAMSMPAGADPLRLHVGIAHGAAHRFIVGDPDIQLIDVLAGATLDRMSAAERLALSGEIVLDPSAVEQLAGVAEFREWRIDPDSGARYGVLHGITTMPALCPWPVLPPKPLTEEAIRPWLLPPVYSRLSEGKGEFLAELRPTVALFLKFGGIDFDLDPDASAKLNVYVQWVQRVVTRFDGQLLQLTIGDKGSFMYAAFGAPVAHSNDAVRAAATALILRNPPAEISNITHSQIGLTVGRVRAGPYGGSTRTYGVLGDTVNLAARLMQAAQPGQVLVSESLMPALDAGYLLQPLAPIRVKGKREPVAIFELTGEREESGIHLNEPRYQLPMIGRDDELSRIQQHLNEAAQGKGRVIGITAEAGMGKSRLIAEAIRMASDMGFAGYGGASQSFGANTAYTIWHSIWRAFFGVDASQSADAQIAAITQSVAGIDPSFIPRIPLLSLTLGMNIPDNDFTRPLDARARKGMLEAMLCEATHRRSHATPLLFVLEDVHWIDSLSNELLEAISHVIADANIIILASYRPPSQAKGALHIDKFAKFANFTEISLGDLSAASSSALIRLKVQQTFGIDTAPDSFIERVAARAQGNPFYIEELISYLQDQHIQPDDAAALQSVELPGSLETLILSHIDTLTEGERATIKVASIIGRRFLASWLWGVYPDLGKSDQVRADLNTLERLGLTPLDSPEPDLAYLFKHSLVQEVAYQSMPFATRCVFHERLAGWMETTMPADALQVDLLAFHYGRTDNNEKALHYASLAGEQATRIGAYAEAAAHLNRALALVKIVNSPAAPQQELALQLNLGAVMINTRGQASSEAKAAYDRARELCQSMETTPQSARATFGLWTFYLFRGELDTAHELAQECWRLAQEPQYAEFRLQTHLVMANTLFWMGRFNEGLAHFDQVVSLYDPAQHHNYIVRYAQNPRITAATTAVVAYWITGRPKHALNRALETFDIAQGLNHDFSVVLALHCLAVVHLNRGDIDALRERAGMLVERASRRNIVFYAALGRIQQGWLKVLDGDVSAGVQEMRKSLEFITATGDTLLHSFYVTLFAEALRRAGQHDEALGVLDKAIASALPSQRLCFIAEMYRMKGLLLHDKDASDDTAEQWLRKAIDVSREQGAHAFELRATLGLAKLMLQQGDVKAAHNLLAPIHTQFNEGFDTQDMRVASELIHILEQHPI